VKIFRSYAALDKLSRIKKAEKIIKIISSFKNISKSTILDIGCGSGFLGSILTNKAKTFIGIDYVDERKSENFNFLIGTSSTLPFKSDQFDIIICNHVIEHVPDQELLLSEIRRILKSGGICYMTCPNKLWPMEPHLKLPFLSWVPKNIADYYVKVSGKGEIYDITPLTYDKFYRKLHKRFFIENYTLNILKFPSRYGFKGPLYNLVSLSRYLPHIALKYANHLLPNWIVILKRRPTS
jgi:2-polyprenyl-3-methyl-5-hydroxy-6-metoxy-1,4-benzoquinol methylase